MEKIDSQSENFCADLSKLLENKPKLVVQNGYAEVSKKFGVAIPQGTRAEFIVGEGDHLMMLAGKMEWLAIEVILPISDSVEKLVIEAETEASSSIDSDVLLRRTFANGKFEDSHHKDMTLTSGEVKALTVHVDNETFFKTKSKINQVSLLIHFRQPPKRVVFKKLGVYVL